MFNILLGLNSKSDSVVNENTIEAAIKLIEKLFFTLEQQIADSNSEERP